MKNIFLTILLSSFYLPTVSGQDTLVVHDDIVAEVGKISPDPVSAFDEAKILEGKELFKHYCKSCHAVTTRLTGPALKGVDTRVDRAWIYEFVRNSTQVISAGDPYANALFMEYNQVEMTSYPNLTNEQIDLILDFIKSEEIAAANAPKFKRPESPHKPYLSLRQGNYFSWSLIAFFTFIIVTATYFVVLAGVKINKP